MGRQYAQGYLTQTVGDGWTGSFLPIPEGLMTEPEARYYLLNALTPKIVQEIEAKNLGKAVVVKRGNTVVINFYK